MKHVVDTGTGMVDELSISRHARQLQQRGYTVLDGLVPARIVEQVRGAVLANLDLLRNTRPNAAAGHLAGFHRYPELEPLHPLVSSNAAALRILEQATGAARMRSIGLSDITVNRSQQWHVDLLRGLYRSHLTSDICWGPRGGGVFKVLLYLQPGATLRVRPGLHLQPVPLDDDRKAEPPSADEVEAVEVTAGGLVLMDIRLPHRGSSEEELRGPAVVREPKILVSTVLAGEAMPLGTAMERGNLERLLDWDRLHRDAPAPRFDATLRRARPA